MAATERTGARGERIATWWAERHDQPKLTPREVAPLLAFGIGALVLAFAMADGFSAVILTVAGLVLVIGGVANLLPDRYRGVTVAVNRTGYVTAPFWMPLTVISIVL